jgi:hypothetical protein
MSNVAPEPLPDGLEPAWDIARLFPPQGGWSEEEYLRLPGNHLSEFDQGGRGGTVRRRRLSVPARGAQGPARLTGAILPGYRRRP